MTGKPVFINGIPHIIEIVEKPERWHFHYPSNNKSGYFEDRKGYDHAMQQYKKATEPLKIDNIFKTQVYPAYLPVYEVKINEGYRIIAHNMTVEFNRVKGGAVITKIN